MVSRHDTTTDCHKRASQIGGRCTAPDVTVTIYGVSGRATGERQRGVDFTS